jgi:hypothetical protein
MFDDYPTDNDRAAWAAAVVEVFGGFSGQNDPDYLTEPIAIAEIVGDLICDLLHFVEVAGGDPTTVLFNGLSNFEYEAAEEAAEQLEADSRYLAFAYFGSLSWDLLVCDSLRSARQELADRAAGTNAEAVMLLYRSLDPETEPPPAGDLFAPAAYVLTATAEGICVDRQ